MKDLDPIIDRCDELGNLLEQRYVEDLCPNEDIMPLFDFEINLNDNES